MHDDYDPDNADDILPLGVEDADDPSDSLLSFVEVDDDAGDGLELDDQQSDEIKRIFSATLPQYLQPVEEMLAQIIGGNAEAETVEALQGTLSSLGSAAARMGFDEVNALLVSLGDQVAQLQQGSAAGAATDEIQQQIEADLAAVKDFARRIGGDDEQGGDEVPATSIFKALRGVEGVDDAVLGRLSAAGLTTVEQLRMGCVDEVAVVSGLDVDLVRRILAQVASRSEGPLGPGASPPDDADTSPPAHSLAAPEVVYQEPPAEQVGAVVDFPVAAAPLEALAERRLEAQVDAEAALEEARADVRELRQRSQRRRAELDELARSNRLTREQLEATAGQLGATSAKLQQAKAARDRMRRSCSESEDVLRGQTARMERLREEKRELAETEAVCERQVAGVVRQLGRVRRLVRTAANLD